MAQTVEFMDSQGFMVTIDSATIKRVTRPLGGYPGEVELTTGAKWSFGGNHTMRTNYYKRVLFAFVQHNQEKQEAAGEQ